MASAPCTISITFNKMSCRFNNLNYSVCIYTYNVHNGDTCTCCALERFVVMLERIHR